MQIFVLNKDTYIYLIYLFIIY